MKYIILFLLMSCTAKITLEDQIKTLNKNLAVIHHQLDIESEQKNKFVISPIYILGDEYIKNITRFPTEFHCNLVKDNIKNNEVMKQYNLECINLEEKLKIKLNNYREELKRLRN